jgi:hypothetical protein
VPSQPVDVIKRSSRWAGQRWLLDAVIGLVGPEWDQGRVAYYAAACGQDSQVDFTAVRPRIRKYDDLAREFSKAARRREVLARDAVHRGHRASARESYFTAAVLYGAAQWAIEANTEFNLLLDRKKTELYRAFMGQAGRIIQRLEIPFGGRHVPAYLHLPAGGGARNAAVRRVRPRHGRLQGNVSRDGRRSPPQPWLCCAGDRYSRAG